MKWETLPFACGILILVSVFVVGIAPYFVAGTNYARGYSETAFNNIKVGASKEEILRALGRPLAYSANVAGHETWFYSFGKKNAMFWESRSLETSNGVLVAKFSFSVVD